MHVHVAVDDAEKAIQVVNGAHRAPPELVALSASSPFWRGEPTGLRSSAPHGLRRLPALRPAAALPRLRRLRAGREPAREDRLHPGLHAHLVGHPPPSAARHDRDPDLRRGDAARRRRSRSPRTARRSSSTTRSTSTAARRSRRSTASSRPRTSGSPRATGSSAPVMDLHTGRRNRLPVAPLDPPHARRRSSRTRASSARRTSSTGSRRSSAAATAPTASCTSSTRTATSSRSCARSRTATEVAPVRARGR